MNEVRASVIIPAHNAADTIGRQLRALGRQLHPPTFEVIVVANRCTDATIDVASQSDSLELAIRTADEHASAAYARNIGAAEASAPYLLFCDADDEVGGSWVSGMLSALIDGEADFVGGKLLVDRSKIPDWMYDWRYEFLDQRCIRERVGRLPYVVSASLGISAEAFRDVGGFDTQFVGAAGEEVDLSWRLLRAGYRIGEAPNATVSYAPRRGVRSNLSHARSYARGGLLLDNKEGLLRRSLSPSGAALMIMKVAAHRIVRKRDLNPLSVYARCRHQLDRWVEHRRFERTAHLPSAGQPQFDFCADIATPLIGGLAFATVRAADGRWYAESGLERASLAAVEHFVPRGGTFIDVGANIGVYAVAAAKRIGRRGAVVAFEPNLAAATLLTKNLERHGVRDSVEVRADAVGARRGRSTFRAYENGLVSGFGEAPAHFHPGELLSESSVDVVTLSEAIRGPADMIKVDVEGFEADVFEGARELLRRSPKMVVLFELNPSALEAAGRRETEVLDYFPAPKWTLRLIDERTPATSPDDIPLFDPSSLDVQSRGRTDWYANLLAIPSSLG